MARPSWRAAISWVLESFGPLIAFFVFEHTLGLVAAIVSSIVSGALLVLLQIHRDRKISPFTVFIAASVVVFGVLDLRYRSGFFIKLEPALGNATTALFFLGTVVIGKPVIVELVRKRRPDLTASGVNYLKWLTVVWGGFFLLKAAVYVWMAFRLSLDTALAVRGVAGPVSFGAMIVGEMGVRYVRFGKAAFGEPAPEAPVQDDEPQGS